MKKNGNYYKRWYVIDGEENQTSYSAKTESAEFFKTKIAARKRAVGLANSEPGKIFYICESIMFADAEIEAATYKTI